MICTGILIDGALLFKDDRNRIESPNTTFGCKVCTKEDKPTNGEFIAMIADKLGMEQRSA